VCALRRFSTNSPFPWKNAAPLASLKEIVFPIFLMVMGLTAFFATMITVAHNMASGGHGGGEGSAAVGSGSGIGSGGTPLIG
jgi:hypothetical protein